MSEFKPNTTQYPNFLFDLMPSLKEGELRLLNAIVRKTYGWQKQKDKISLSQMIELTGMSKQGILDARERLINKGIIKAEIVNGIMEYMVIIPDDLDVHKVDKQAPEVVKIEQVTSQNRTNLDVHNVDPQKKELQNKSTKEKEDHASKFKDSMERTRHVKSIIDKHLQSKWKTKVDDDSYNCHIIANKILDDEDVEEFMNDILARYRESWWADKVAPQPKQIVKAWDQILAIQIPEWKRLGYGSEYAYNLDKRKSSTPQPPPIYPEVPQQVATVKPEDIDNFMNAMDELKT